MSKKIFIFLIIFLIVLGFLVFNFRKTEKVEATTNTFEVLADADDAYEYDRGGGFFSPFYTWDETSVKVCSYSDSSSVTYRSGGFRFQNVAIPPGATVISAEFRGYVYIAGGDVNTYIFGNDEDNAENFVDDPYIFTSRPRTTAFVKWVQDDLPLGWASTANAGLDLKDIIQEIINRPGWSSGNAIVLLFIADSGAGVPTKEVQFYGYATTRTTQARLVITWSEPPAITSVSDSPDPQAGGSAVSFTSEASDPDAGDTIQLYICDSSSCLNCGPGTDNSGCRTFTSPPGVATNPSASYTCPSCTATVNNYWVKVCDNYDLCSSIISGGSFSCLKENGCAETNPGYCFSGYAVGGVCSGPVGGNLYGWAWSEKIGWISFNSKNCDPDDDGFSNGIGACPPAGTFIPDYGVFLPIGGAETRYFQGYAWSDRIGWIRFSPPIPYPDWAVTDCQNSNAYMMNYNIYGLVRACAGAPNPSVCGGGIGPNPNSGGWDGWICLNDLGTKDKSIPPDGTNDNWYGVTLDYNVASPTFNQFANWAWGGGGTSTDGTNAVVGWISFNSKDYDTAPLFDHKVTYQPANDPPTVSGLQLNEKPKYCYVGPEQGQVSFKWTYSDPDGDPQYRFDFRVNDVNDVDDPNPEVDRRFCNTSSNTQTVLVKPSLVSSSHTYCSGTPDEYTPTVDTPDAITYNTSYYWWVRVFDNRGGDSGWIQYNDPADTDEDPDDNNPLTFTTIAHAKPWVDFRWCPYSPIVDEPIQFCSIAGPGVCATVSECQSLPPQPLPADPTACYVAACNSWAWDFGDGSPISNDQNPTHSYGNAGSYGVTLRVTDSDTFYCTTSQSVHVGIALPLPEWKEIPPTF